jgi:rhamnosyltransferase
MKSDKPKIAVLMAAYNGEKYIEKQLISILNQVDVEVSIHINLDKSSDNTLSVISKFKKTYPNISIISDDISFGSACSNFFFLLSSIDLNEYDFISLSDQDDVWFENKLIQAVSQIELKNVSSYSSNVIAVWPNKKRKKIYKSFSQKPFDHFFESGGPGNTYVFRKDFAVFLQEFLKKNAEAIKKVEHYDWFIYSLAKEYDFKWYLDDFYSLEYLQHGNNEIGANLGIKAYLKRARLLFNGSWFIQSRIICSLTIKKNQDFFIEWSNLNFYSFLFLAYSSKKCRRNVRDQLVFFIVCTLLSLKSLFIKSTL